MARFKKLSVVYHAPAGDSKVVDNVGVTFFDGQATEVIATPEQHDMLENNPHFEVVSATDHDKPPEPAHQQTKAEAKAEAKADKK